MVKNGAVVGSVSQLDGAWVGGKIEAVVRVGLTTSTEVLDLVASPDWIVPALTYWYSTLQYCLPFLETLLQAVVKLLLECGASLHAKLPMGSNGKRRKVCAYMHASAG